MALEDTLRVAETFPNYEWVPKTYSSPRPSGDPNWYWLDLWVQENPAPPAPSIGSEEPDDWDYWYEKFQAMKDRIWVAWALPQFRVFDWTDEDVQKARDLIRGHVCSVCGRSDDPGCSWGC